MSTVIPLEFRPIEPGDFNMVLSNWLTSYREYQCGPKRAGDDLAPQMNVPRRIHAQLYFESQQRVISELSTRRKIIVGSDPEHKDLNIGWICGEMQEFQDAPTQCVVDYVYVKLAYRKAGVAKSLLINGLGWRGEPIVATHWTRVCDSVVKRYPLSFNDYLLKMGNYNVQA